MKQTLTTLLIIATIGLMLTGMISCRKTTDSPDLKTYDQQQIQAYLQANNLTGYTRDLSGGDTTGIYYKITKPGSGTPLDYSDLVFFVYTITSLDGKYVQSDTVINHSYNYVGHLNPPGLILAMKNIIKYRGAQGHVIIPSHLAYGTAGSGTGSSRLTGNESLDYYINVIDPANQATYDDLLIQKFMSINSLTGFTKTNSGLYYKITQPGTGKNKVTTNSTIGGQYALKLLNSTVVQDLTNADTSVTTTTLPYANVVKGVQEGFGLVTSGAKISLILPSALGYGLTGTTGVVPNSCLYFDFYVRTITN